MLDCVYELLFILGYLDDGVWNLFIMVYIIMFLGFSRVYFIVYEYIRYMFSKYKKKLLF